MGLLKELFETVGVNSRGRDVRAQTVNREHREREKDTFPEIGDPEDVRYCFEKLSHAFPTKP